MRKPRFTKEQMVAIIREADHEPVSAVAKGHGASRRLSGERCQALKQLEAKNAGLTKLVAERDLEIEVMKEVAAKNWRACGLAGGKLRMAGSVVSLPSFNEAIATH
jgi:putative transposase